MNTLKLAARQANDKQQLAPVLAAISPAITQVSNILVDSGYYSKAAIETIESGDNKPTVYAAMKRQPHGRSIAQLEERSDPPPPAENTPMAERMAHRLDTARGKDKVNLEWTLVTTSYNLKRLFNLRMHLQKA